MAARLRRAWADHGGQKIQVGLAHARKTAVVTVDAGTYQVTVESGITITAPRTGSRDIGRHGIELQR